MSLTLEERVKAFQAGPGHDWFEPGLLISDLWKEVQRLQKLADNSDLYARSILADMGAENERLRKELDQTRVDAANVVRALDAAIQYAETLLAFLAEEGAPLHPNVIGAWTALQEALTTIGVRKP